MTIPLIMKLEREVEGEVFYCKKALKVAVPIMGDVQSRKNPFNKGVQDSTLSSTQHGTLFELNEVNVLNQRSDTIRVAGLQFPHPAPTQIPKPSRLSSEQPDDCLDWLMDSEMSADMEEEKTTVEKCKARISKEVEYNFKILRTLPLPSEEEVKLHEVKLSCGFGNIRSSDKTLVLDLDETLIHTINVSLDYSAVNIPQKKVHSIFYKDKEDPSFNIVKVIIRPYAIEFLERLSEVYEIVVSLPKT
eukprot:TRINITY_DN6020_c0_g2_i9.p1 TRINITY_DN6020_c0_g2~~TRINITY_DN6020_c0_g2_i9.p1  ORF type:complete len:246 (+),score=31.25 TRINITY_DN6020_c0_g2_i9:177-914(+)